MSNYIIDSLCLKAPTSSFQPPLLLHEGLKLPQKARDIIGVFVNHFP